MMRPNYCGSNHRPADWAVSSKGYVLTSGRRRKKSKLACSSLLVDRQCLRHKLAGFTATFLQDVFKLSNSTHRECTAYHPQTHGFNERLSRTITDILSMYVELQHKDWDEILPYATFAYNTAMQETTRCAPFELVYRRSLTTTLHAILPVDSTDGTSTDAKAFTQWAEEAHLLALISIRHQQEFDAEKYKGRRNVDYQPGDLVWVWTPIHRKTPSEKLLRRYFGPYGVLRRLSDVTYEVVPEDTTRSSRRRSDPEAVHVVRLKS